ncbi:hypothetical protein L211DRAFT_847117 [Terfezia boudieri ATCC MYA-4762]|uniref:Uncharacterized protein n=1 Tax=Terfezia boudieri ATCC MYA-4762 TaxID=1051890 RepID=A0A3N4LXN5_9PEZI|nr:hypothetical protein L211DRAFT_847117 [Terfezia boudieri ATCC MYA-4762]
MGSQEMLWNWRWGLMKLVLYRSYLKPVAKVSNLRRASWLAEATQASSTHTTPTPSSIRPGLAHQPIAQRCSPGFTKRVPMRKTSRQRAICNRNEVDGRFYHLLFYPYPEALLPGGYHGGRQNVADVIMGGRDETVIIQGQTQRSSQPPQIYSRDPQTTREFRRVGLVSVLFARIASTTVTNCPSVSAASFWGTKGLEFNTTTTPKTAWDAPLTTNKLSPTERQV